MCGGVLEVTSWGATVLENLMLALISDISEEVVGVIALTSVRITS
jgi:hypothetical protein